MLIRIMVLLLVTSPAAAESAYSGSPTSYAMSDDRKLAGVGFGLSFGVGVISFVDANTRDSMSGDVGGMWNLRATFGSHIPIGLELSYAVTATEMIAAGDAGSYVGQSFDAVLRWNVLPHCTWTPYAFAGVGWQLYDVVSTETARIVRIHDDVHRVALPLGAGIAYRDRSGLTFDLRGTFRAVDDRARTPIGLDSWEAAASIGHDL
jgi:hypothetical protein